VLIERIDAERVTGSNTEWHVEVQCMPVSIQASNACTRVHHNVHWREAFVRGLHYAGQRG
jgi:hypothetical protein